MSKFIIEIINKSGQIRTRTISVPRNVESVEHFLRQKVHKLIEPSPKYRHTSSAFWKEWNLHQYYKA